jgi:hypothetical protein
MMVNMHLILGFIRSKFHLTRIPITFSLEMILSQRVVKIKI